MVVLLAGTWSGAAVTVDAPPHCLTVESVDLEARAALGDPLVDRYDIHARVIPEASSSWTLDLHVAEEGVVLWHRSVNVVEADCPHLPALVALSVERGLSELPNWLKRHGPRPISEVDLSLAASLPLPARLGGTFVWSYGLRSMYRAELAIDGSVSSDEVGTGSVQMVGVSGLLGGAMDAVRFARRKSMIRFAVRGGAGPVWVVGSDFGPHGNGVEVRPRVTGMFDVIFALGSTIRIGLRGEVSGPQLRLIDEVSGAVVEEPLGRVGLSVGFGVPSPKRLTAERISGHVGA